MAGDTTRIFSDIHYGDHASAVRSLRQIAPLFDGVSRVVLNGDTFDSRPGPHPERSAALRAEVLAFFGSASPGGVLMTGNHDPDISKVHAMELAGGKVFVTHGDILFDDIVPWGRDAPHIRKLIAAGKSRLDSAGNRTLETELELFRSVAWSLPQRHQVEPDFRKFIGSYLRDTLWPPTKMFSVIRAWREAPELAAKMARDHRPNARFVIVGHIHRQGVWRTREGRVVINTGAFCPPSSACLVDLSGSRLVVRRIDRRSGEYRAGRTLAEFALEESGD